MSEMKQSIVIRGDLKITCGKAIAQGAHASVTAVISIIESNNRDWKKWLKEWLREGQKKVVLRAASENELEQIYVKAKAKGIPVSLVTDAGLTELAPGTKTAVALGPAPKKTIDSITGSLPLYRYSPLCSHSE